MAKKVKVKVKVNLPSDIIETKILSRLPVRTLIRFKAVQKSWYSLISDPFFITLHYQIQNKNPNYCGNQLLMQLDCGAIVVADSYSPTRSTFDYSYDPRYHHFDVVGSFNGIVCLYGYSCTPARSRNIPEKHICLWNPSLRTCKFFGHWNHHYGRIRTDRVAFGFNKKRGIYTVFMFNNAREGVNLYKSLNGHELCSSSLHAWRSITTTDVKILVRRKNKLIDVGVYVIYNEFDAFCWLGLKYDEAASLFRVGIALFDLEDETFKEITLPQTQWDIDNTSIFSFKESLAVLASCPKSYRYNIWVMNKPGSWTKHYTIVTRNSKMSLLGLVSESQLILMRTVSGEMHVIDLDKADIDSTSSIKNIKNLTKASHITSYQESLVLI